MRVLDLFSGIGAFSVGLERAGMRTVSFCEIDPFCRRVLAKHWPEVPCYHDVKELSAQHLTAGGVGDIDLICGGFPCQDISVAGRGAGIAGERSGLWTEFARLIGEIQPRYAIVENVAALLGRGLGDVLGDLASLGYDAEWHCIPASAVGAPHIRDRVWIVAYADRAERREIGDSCDRLGERKNGLLSQREEGPGGLGPSREEMAYTDGAGCSRPGPAQSDEWRRNSIFTWTGKNVADATCQLPHRSRLFRQGGWRRELTNGDWWLVEPDVGRVANGIASRVDRLRGLGNSLVPQIPEIIGRAIMDAD